ncbi:MAG: DUF4268 domain-containing protein [bacterium]|nr:DUF4268 domain-containing protein [bacterium]
MNISKAQFIPIRQAFPHEAHDFTQWLSKNLDALSDRIGITFSDIEPEKSVGSFNVDIFCKDSAGHNVIIENQLERTNHDHLGKVLTYMVNLEAKTAIWVAIEARPEHEAVVSWLNQFTPVDMRFYFVKLEAIRIGDSVAPWFTVLVAPDEQLSEIGEQKKNEALSNIKLLYFEFWTYFLDYTDGKTILRYKTPGGKSYKDVNGASIKNGLSIGYNVNARDGKVGVYLYIDLGDSDDNKKFFDHLYEIHEKIELQIGAELDWRKSDREKSCRIFYLVDGIDINDKSQWEKIADTLIDMMTHFEKAFHPYINR